MVERRRLSELTSAEIFQRAAGFAEKARAPDTHGDLRDAYHRLAVEYAALAARREMEEGAAVRH